MPDLHYERYSAFEHDMFDRMDYVSLARLTETIRPSEGTAFSWSMDYDSLARLTEADAQGQGVSLIAQREAQQLRSIGYSIVQDAFYALRGLTPRSTTAAGRGWARMIETEAFADMRRKAKDVRDRATMIAHVLALSDVVWANLSSRAQTTRDADGEVIDVDLPVIDEGALNIAGEQADDKAKMAAIMAGFMDEGSPAEKIDRALTLANLHYVRGFAEFLGWVKRVVGGAARRGHAAAGEMTGYRNSGWSDAVTPADMGLVASAHPHALARLAENGLTRRHYASNEPAGKGPVILLVDGSGSMSTGQRHDRARMFELTLAKAFNEEGRDLVVVDWGESYTPSYTYGEPGFLAHYQSFLSAGATRVLPALQKALALADEYVAGADILIVTDGALDEPASMTKEEWSAYTAQLFSGFRAQGGRVWALTVGGASNAHRLGFCDGWADIESIDRGEKVGEVLAGMADRSGDKSEKVYV